MAYYPYWRNVLSGRVEPRYGAGLPVDGSGGDPVRRHVPEPVGIDPEFLEDIESAEVVVLDGSGSMHNHWLSTAGINLHEWLFEIEGPHLYWNAATMHDVPRPIMSSTPRPPSAGEPCFGPVAQWLVEQHGPAADSYSIVFITDDLEGGFARDAAANGWVVWTFHEVVTANLRQWRDQVAELEAEYKRKIAESVDNQQQRNRWAIEFHGKLDRLASNKNLPVALRTRVVVLTDRLLRDVFKINVKPDPIIKPRTPPGTPKAETMDFIVMDEIFKAPPTVRKESPVHATELTIRVIDSYANDDVAGVTVEMGRNSFDFRSQRFTGSAKRNPVDPPNPRVGLALAEARAVRKAYRFLEEEAKIGVAAIDQKHKEAAHARAQAKAAQRKVERAARKKKADAQLVIDQQREIESLRKQVKSKEKVVPTRRSALKRT